VVRLLRPQTTIYKEAAVRQLGEDIGYGRVMQAAEKMWREKLSATGHEGGELTTGPCAAFVVRCPHTVDKFDGRRDPGDAAGVEALTGSAIDLPSWVSIYNVCGTVRRRSCSRKKSHSPPYLTAFGKPLQRACQWVAPVHNGPTARR
jgi:hypothetical protein